jgi:hypothetical protein
MPHEVDSLLLDPVAADPSGTVDGQLWYNSTTGGLRGQAGGVVGPIGGLLANQHRSLAQLIHFLDNGPDSNAYREALPAGAVFPTSVTWWDSSSKTTKLVEKLITWSGAFPTQVVWKVYSAGVLQETATDTYAYTGGNQLTPKVTRVFS